MRVTIHISPTLIQIKEYWDEHIPLGQAAPIKARNRKKRGGGKTALVPDLVAQRALRRA